MRVALHSNEGPSPFFVFGRHTVPAMVVVLCFFLFPLFISGPQDRDLMGQEQRGCFENWWTVMAHIVNFVPTEKRVGQIVANRLPRYCYIKKKRVRFLRAMLGKSVKVMIGKKNEKERQTSQVPSIELQALIQTKAPPALSMESYRGLCH